jgi:putative sigma-54 modulation protein
MQLAVTFRHMDATPALKEYAREKVDRINKYFPDPIKAHVVLSTDRGFNHVADVMITLHNGFVIKGEETTEDMYSSIDLVMAKIERQVRRYKEKLQHHRPVGRETPPREFNLTVMAMNEAAALQPSEQGSAAPSQYTVVKKDKFVAQPLSIEHAILQLNLQDNDFLVFTNAVSRDVNVVYRRKDGTYGLIETGASNSNH